MKPQVLQGNLGECVEGWVNRRGENRQGREGQGSGLRSPRKRQCLRVGNRELIMRETDTQKRLMEKIMVTRNNVKLKFKKDPKSSKK